MNENRLPPLAAAVLAGLAVAAFLAVSPRPSEAGPAPAADAGPPPPRFDAEPFSDDKTPLPTAADWKPTTPVSLTTSLPQCRAYRVREWVKIRCAPFTTSSIALLGGSREGVSFFLDRSPWEGGPPPGGEMVFPVRRGDRRVFEWSLFGDSYEGVGAPEVAFMVSESWVPGEPSPVIILH